MELIPCIRCKGKGQQEDKRADGGDTFDCGLCEGRGYLDPVIPEKVLTREEKEQKMWDMLTVK